ncbi:uncharacterized protein LOC132631071 [Lycium barbarum]|uniref:uncharacterized protein LOC132631071 n=1 Tax=Lycium barbarum TaxID=112863 RepID=UPI00293E81D6|nr:uncharacterized protein LOC132631071 [Lycium barbarum]
MTKALHIEEEYWKQKSSMTWFQERDKNSKFFHSNVKRRSKRLQLKRIHDSQDEQNEELTADPTMEEVKHAVFGLNNVSAGGPDGFTGNVLSSIGHELPRYITHTNLVLLPKKQDVQTFGDMRPISLSNFVNKIFSRVIHERMVHLLPDLISQNQAGFVRGRSIVENILLTQEIITDIRLRTKKRNQVVPNVVMKLDMTKAYDRLSWIFLTKVMRKMGFCETFISFIYELVGNNWYSVFINGQPDGFFHSTRGVKQGDPLSPTLFIIAAEVLSRALNSLHNNLWFIGFGLPKWSPKINHLAYADDTIIFTSSCEISLGLIMRVLAEYEAASGELINKAKSSVYLHDRVEEEIFQKVERLIGISRKEFPLIYLGCPIYYIRSKMAFYSEMLAKVRNRLQSWKGKLLSLGGRAVLLQHVLQAMPIHLLAAVDPPSFEGGLGFRSLADISIALFAKLWWNFRTKPSLWSAFMSNKYLKKNNSILVPWKQGSDVWRKMLQARDLMDHQIWWQLRMGSSLFWFDNWSGIGPLYFIVPPEFQCNEAIENVSDVVTDGRWHVPAIRNNLPEDLAEYILHEVKPPAKPGEIDKPWWMLEKNREFSVKYVWEYLKSKGEKKEVYKKIWVKGLPFKIAFLMWRVWHFKIPLDEVVKSWGYHMPSRCFCCVELNEETVPHIFLRSTTAQATWKYFCAAAGINVDGIHLHQLWKKRNGDKHRDKVSTSRVIYQASTDIQQLVRSRKPGIKNIPHRWHDILKMLEQFVPKLQVTKVMWKFPPGGDLIYAEARRMGECTNTESEAKALLQAARYCLSKHVYSFYMETDSLLLKNILDREWKPPWNITFEVEELLDIMNHAEVQVLHIMREGNQLADHLANYALDHGEVEVNSFAELESKGRKILNSDKLQCPYLRIRTKRKYCGWSQIWSPSGYKLCGGNKVQHIRKIHTLNHICHDIEQKWFNGEEINATLILTQNMIRWKLQKHCTHMNSLVSRLQCVVSALGAHSTSNLVSRKECGEIHEGFEGRRIDIDNSSTDNWLEYEFEGPVQ